MSTVARKWKHRGEWSIKHGKAGTRIYGVWADMLGRCRDPKDSHYHLYGGRGITVCERWYKFENFYADMGDRPDGKSLDRINNNGNYEPGNVRWATPEEQIRNTRRNVNVTFNGKTMCLKDWSLELGIKYETLRSRLGKFGWPVEKAFTTVQARGSNRFTTKPNHRTTTPILPTRKII